MRRGSNGVLVSIAAATIACACRTLACVAEQNLHGDRHRAPVPPILLADPRSFRSRCRGGMRPAHAGTSCGRCRGTLPPGRAKPPRAGRRHRGPSERGGRRADHWALGVVEAWLAARPWHQQIAGNGVVDRLAGPATSACSSGPTQLRVSARSDAIDCQSRTCCPACGCGSAHMLAISCVIAVSGIWPDVQVTNSFRLVYSSSSSSQRSRCSNIVGAFPGDFDDELCAAVNRRSSRKRPNTFVFQRSRIAARDRHQRAPTGTDTDTVNRHHRPAHRFPAYASSEGPSSSATPGWSTPERSIAQGSGVGSLRVARSRG